jgi:hypothetical protein
MNKFCEECGKCLDRKHKKYCSNICTAKARAADIPSCVKEEYEAGYTLKHIARKYHTAARRIEKKIIDLGGVIDKSIQRKRFSPVQEKLKIIGIEDLSKMLEAHKFSIKNLAKTLQISDNHLRLYCKDNNIEIPKIKNIPTCHPDRKYKAKGLCDKCYDIFLYNQDPEKQKNKHKKWSKHNKDHLKQYRQKRREQNPLSYVLNHLKKRAKDKKFEFNLTIQDLKDVWTDICPVFGIKMEFNKNEKGDNSYSVDRIDSTKGYTKNNICIISWRANRLKCDASLEELEKIVQYMRSKKPSNSP